MITCKLTAHKVTDLLVVVHLEQQQKLQLSFASPFSVRYTADNRHCVATLEQSAAIKDAPNKFHISLKMEGYFDVEGVENEEDRKEVHVQCYHHLFPYAQMLIEQMSVHAGLPPLRVPPLNMTVDSVSLGSDHPNA